MVPRLPESPRWLMRDGTSAREAAAREVLVKTCGEAAAGPALEEIKQVIAAQNGAERARGGYHRSEFDGEGPAEPGDKSPKPAGRGTWNALLSETVARRALLIGAGTAFFQQANGSEAAVYYVPQVLRAAGVRSEHSQLQAAALVGVCKTVCIVIGQFTVDVYGRRVMLLSSIAAVTGSLVMLAWCLGAGAAGGATAGITLAALCLFMMSFSLGVGPVTWVVTSEIFPLHVRSKGVAFSMALNRLTSGSVAMTFLSLVAAVGVGGPSPCSPPRRRRTSRSRSSCSRRPRGNRSRRSKPRSGRCPRGSTSASRNRGRRRRGERRSGERPKFVVTYCLLYHQERKERTTRNF